MYKDLHRLFICVSNERLESRKTPRFLTCSENGMVMSPIVTGVEGVWMSLFLSPTSNISVFESFNLSLLDLIHVAIFAMLFFIVLVTKV